MTCFRLLAALGAGLLTMIGLPTSAATPAPTSARRPKPPRGRGRPSSLAPRLDARLENLCARAFALREPLLGRTPRRAPGMLGGML